MELRIDQKRKKQYQKNIAGSLKNARIIRLIAKILLFVGIVGGGAYAILNLVVFNFSMVSINGIPQKDVAWIIISTSFIVTPCLILSLALNTLSKNLAGGVNSSRIDESILVTKESIRYSYRQKYQSVSRERRVLTIEFNKINSIIFDKKTKLLRLSGEIRSEYFDDYNKKRPVESNNINEFVICDYFSPSLKETLLTQGVKVNN